MRNVIYSYFFVFMKRILSWLLIIGLLPLSSFTSVFAVASLPSGKTSAKVIEVIDGDTIKVDINGSIDTIRILGIDTPEKSKTRTGHKECYGDEATQYAISVLSGATINLEKDTKQKARDIYDRMLAHVWIWDELYGAKIIQDGYSFRYTKTTTKYQSTFLKAEKVAKKSKQGVWDVCKGKRTPLLTTNSGAQVISVPPITPQITPTTPTIPTIDTSITPKPLIPVITAPLGNYSCSSIPTYCSGVKTREEAQFYLNTCGIEKFDRDHDGIACEAVK